jgi:uncharacterized damage-inducible protein DinB
MDPRLEGLLRILDMNTLLFQNCLKGISEETARQKPNSESNSVAFLACHVVDARSYLAQLIGAKLSTDLHDVLPTYLAVVEHHDEPPMADVVSEWSGMSEVVRARLIDLKSEDLDAASPETLSTDDPSLFGAIAFLLHHEAYHIGQIAFARKYFGVGSMRYGHKALLSRP